MLFLAEPHDGGLTGPGEPALDASLAGIPSTTLVNCLNGDQGVITEVGKSASSCNAVFPKLGHIPDANKDIVLANSDAHGEPQIIANHPMCAATASDPLSLDALDFFACWKILDGLGDCAFSRANCEYALDDTPEHRFMGLWSDGVPVSELKIQKTAPIAPNDGDGDGCLDVRELGPSHATGGQRDPNNPWDVFDAPGSVAADPAPNGQRNKAVSIADLVDRIHGTGWRRRPGRQSRPAIRSHRKHHGGAAVAVGSPQRRRVDPGRPGRLESSRHELQLITARTR